MIQFHGQDATRFAIGNPVFVPVPVPNLAWLIVPALLGGLVWRRRAQA